MEPQYKGKRDEQKMSPTFPLAILCASSAVTVSRAKLLAENNPKLQ
jgi:hypothetical protein